MSVRFNTLGTQILALRRRLPPILYSTANETPICQFYHPDYYNSCTMKSCSFAGENDDYILSGSDDFNLYMWRKTDADRKLRPYSWNKKAHFYLCFLIFFLQSIKPINSWNLRTWFFTVIDRLSIRSVTIGKDVLLHRRVWRKLLRFGNHSERMAGRAA